VDNGIAERCVVLGEDCARTLYFFATFGGVVPSLVFVGLESGDKRRRYLRTGSLDFFVGDELGVFEGVVGPVVGVACAVKVISWS
jgi:hypothetical protein